MVSGLNDEPVASGAAHYSVEEVLDDHAGGCPIEATLAVIGGKWKGIIIYHLDNGPIRYNELNRRLSQVTPRILSKQLAELEDDGVVHREVFDENPPRVEYSLTDVGQSLTPILSQLGEWGIQFMKNMSQEQEDLHLSRSSKRVAKMRQSVLAEKNASERGEG